MTNSAFSAGEARYLREPEPVTCHRHGFTYLPDDEDCPGCVDDRHGYACNDTPRDGEHD